MARFPTELAPIFTPMTNDDLPAVMEMENVSFPSPWSVDTYRREIVTRNGSYWVVRPTVQKSANAGEAGPDIPRLLAYAGMWLLGDDAHITTIATHPAWRQRHIGEWLLIQMAGEARSHRISALTLEVRIHNRPALALYEKLGFVAVGLRRGYYQDTGEDARLLTLFAIDHPTVWEKLQARLEEIERA
ncbi:MAG: ribosomal protein S18-alanine N-acetyltransferase [Caldilineaceae bacterium]|nr:ribosomal protein S18-alanine N-acetyltransferase [Caldilineaceae bacterium]